MYKDNDYVVTETRVYGVKGNWPRDAHRILVKPVYEKNSSEIWNKIVDRRGAAGENFEWIDPSKMQFVDSRGLDDGLLESELIWGNMARTLVSLGIEKSDIGYFGSYRLGFKNAKDVDFVLYGEKAHDILRSQMDAFKQRTGTYNLTEEHALYQAHTHGSHYTVASFYLVRCLLNKWSSCMIRPGICSTVRFVNPNVETGGLLEKVFTDMAGTVRSIIGIARETWGTSYFPRTFTLVTEEAEYRVVVPLWIYHQCVKDGDLVVITGEIIKNLLILRDYEHGIQHL